MTDALATLPEDWIDILPPAIPMGDYTRPGDLVVFEWRVENNRRIPGAWARISSVRYKRRGVTATWDQVGGEILLTRDQHREFLNGQVPSLWWPAPFDCPVTLRLADDFDVTIDGLERVKKAGFTARWKPERLTIRDMRPELMLRAGVLPNTRYRKGHDDAVHGPTSLEIELAAVESAYTRDRSRSADREVSAVMPDDVGAVSRAEVFRAERRAVARRDPYRSTRKAA